MKRMMWKGWVNPGRMRTATIERVLKHNEDYIDNEGRAGRIGAATEERYIAQLGELYDELAHRKLNEGLKELIKPKMGRPPVPVKQYRVTPVCIDNETREFLKGLGEGSMSEGVRRLVAKAMKGKK